MKFTVYTARYINTCSHMLFEIVALRNFAKLTGNHPQWRPFISKVGVVVKFYSKSIFIAGVFF